MVGVTARAKKELKKILAAKVDMPQAGLRLVSHSQSELGLGVDIELPGDQVVRYDGSKVLLVENRLAKKLEGVTLDIDDTPDGPQLVFCGNL